MVQRLKEGDFITKQINQDVAGFKDDFFKGLSLRECIYGGTALGLGVGSMLALIFIYKVNINVAITICMPIIAVIGLCGFYEKNGMTLPKIVRAFVRIKRQKPLTYQTCRPEDRQSLYIVTKDIAKDSKESKKQHDKSFGPMVQKKKKRNGGQ